MAKPGSADAARLAAMSRSAKDLGGGPLTGEAADKAIRQAEAQLGMRCGGCGERIGVGLQFTRIDAVMSNGKPTIDVAKLSACNGADGCDFAEKARKGADVIEMVDYAWLHGDSPVGAAMTLDEQVAAAEKAAGKPSAAEARANGASGLAPG